MPRQRLSHSLMLVLISIQVSSFAAAWGQAEPEPEPNPVSHSPQWSINTKHTTNEVPLKEVPDLPQLPSYSGKTKFLTGRMATSDNGASVYQFSCLAKEPPQQVREWYRNALNMYRWVQDEPDSSSPIVRGEQKNGSLCSISVVGAGYEGYSTKIDINYTVAPERKTPGGGFTN